MKTPEEWQARLGLLIKLGRVTSNEVALFQAAMLAAWEAAQNHTRAEVCQYTTTGYGLCRMEAEPCMNCRAVMGVQPPPELAKKGTTDE